MEKNVKKKEMDTQMTGKEAAHEGMLEKETRMGWKNRWGIGGGKKTSERKFCIRIYRYVYAHTRSTGKAEL